MSRCIADCYAMYNAAADQAEFLREQDLMLAELKGTIQELQERMNALETE